jgi:demethylmenaquinone methyltransferase/2-methoxy-6-polyprenyl-1,4-benzoquinol methylase
LNLPSKKNKEQFVRDMFNSIAPRYDLLNTLMSLGMDRRWRLLAVKRSRVLPGGRALDICCGTGMLTLELARAVGREGHVIGLDFSQNMLDIARQRVNRSPLQGIIDLVSGNAMSLPFEENSFDAVTVGWGLRNVPDIKTVVKEMERVVKPGGMVVSLDMAKPELPVFKQIYWLYFEKLVPLMGKVWAKQETAYSYLHNSARAFTHQKELANIFRETGLVETGYTNLFGGVVALVAGKKPQI